MILFTYNNYSINNESSSGGITKIEFEKIQNETINKIAEQIQKIEKKTNNNDIISQQILKQINTLDYSITNLMYYIKNKKIPKINNQLLYIIFITLIINLIMLIYIIYCLNFKIKSN